MGNVAACCSREAKQCIQRYIKCNHCHQNIYSYCYCSEKDGVGSAMKNVTALDQLWTLNKSS